LFRAGKRREESSYAGAAAAGAKNTNTKPIFFGPAHHTKEEIEELMRAAKWPE